MIIKIENLYKKYLLTHHGCSLHYGSLKEELTRHLKRGLNKFRGRISTNEPLSKIEDFWALSNINLEIHQGDKIALLGRNGAGKSTLLRIISRITEPTKGRLTIHGRVSSVLEVGTGFHPDLTGRENIFLNGAVMGMSYREMKQKFDEIVAFADIDQFLDTPVKRYSSGMFTRLGFAVAAHLDSDLLIVDEVLAVGDAQFQQKCLAKMHEIGSKGSTVLFVSHNVSSVLALCNKGIFLERGQLIAFEAIDKALNRYLSSCPTASSEWNGSAGDEHILINKARLMAPGNAESYFKGNETAQLNLEIQVLKPHPQISLSCTILNSKRHPIAMSYLEDQPTRHAILNKEGFHRLSFDIDMNLFHPGEYYVRIDCSLKNRKKILMDEILLKFAICPPDYADQRLPMSEKEGISLGNGWNSHSLSQAK